MNRFSIAFVTIVSTALAGCGQPQVPQDRFYRLATALPEKTFETPRLEGSLVVERFVADGLISERSIVYATSSDTELEQYHYHYWIDSPTRMLQELMVSYLRAVNLATQVVTSEFRIAPDYTLSGKIKRLEQVRGGSPQVVAELEFGLKSRTGGGLLWLKEYRVEEDAADDSVGSAVNALSKAVSRIYAELLEDISRV